ncbi:MAG: hypothetical protein QM734_02705 [Cyclobacteriaceae bacterium]
MIRKIIFTTAFGLFFVFGKAQENFKKIFSSDYEKASQFLNKEKWIQDSIRSYGMHPKEAIAIIFPELIRYSSVQDKIETFALESLYIQYGKDYSNFSINQFQIKPSFAEAIEIDFLKTFKGEKKKIFQFSVSDTIQNQNNRANRLERIKSKSGMVDYLCLFILIMDKKYPHWKNREEKIKFFASAYNCGYQRPKSEIESYQSKKFFYTGIPILSTKYCYADIALYFFKQP